MNCPFDSGGRLRNVEEKASISGDVRGLSSPVCHVQFAESILSWGRRVAAIHPEGSLCSVLSVAQGLYPQSSSQVSVPVLGGRLPFPLT